MDQDQLSISRTLAVTADFDAALEVRRRIDFLGRYLRQASCRTFVLGISGGVDSLVAGLLAQAAVSEVRADGYDAQFIAVRLPYGVQADETDAQKSLDVIGPDRVVTVDIQPAADAMLDAVMAEGEDLVEPARKHFHLGNIKARQRMVAQYALAGSTRGLVIGTDQAAEALMGFFTKFGDGAADILPLAGLTKRRVRAIAEHMGAPRELVFKVPTADLESDAPLRPDEDVYGVTYDDIDDFLEGKAIAEPARQRILKTYWASAHKRALPVAPIDEIAG
ncbi:ammonia-dependent NAD(+) synthetase [Rhizobium leguminosarum]|uniref:ammonia-dependent NAD(+) synthetase n=1 Tax=Rhizobium leguminosarum TaxID=384 RepID=UPI00027D77DA|nr:ammonia-dependent NAD(+) synthetase [Rhizobium leguminosarum]EJC71062.1 NAD+ synthetase [Rhizobium leguminosarum bv. viciae WSM1455]MBY5323417.1 ammonia-dependent NAD(+) synthetase [Rhizobium leguminosarum]MBY5381501.1 ammonia-dependent NAD(+) synthetase [Rhizobium leguminosarum]NEH68680.1 ammonia-dependent NAD(+) synthetase [Rhizobium leguminosarum]